MTFCGTHSNVVFFVPPGVSMGNKTSAGAGDVQNLEEPEFVSCASRRLRVYTRLALIKPFASGFLPDLPFRLQAPFPGST
jgi:hypothetical protein